MQRCARVLVVLSTLLVVVACQNQTEADRALEQELIEYLYAAHLPRRLVTAQREGQGGDSLPCPDGPVIAEWPVNDEHHTIEFAILALTDDRAVVQYSENQTFPDLMAQAPEGIVGDFDCYELELARESSGQWRTVSKKRMFRAHTWG